MAVLQVLQDALSGTGGSVAATAILYPLDATKTRIQASSERGNYLLLTTREIRRDGLAIYKGLGVSLLRNVFVNFIFYYAYARIKAIAWFSRGKSWAKVARGMAHGLLAGAVVQLTTLPLDRLMVMAMTETGKRGTLGNICAIYKDRGLGGFWAGLGPGLVLTLNPSISMLLIDQLQGMVRSAFMRGSIGKIVASIVTYPYVLAKVQLQAARKQAPPPPGEVAKGEEGEAGLPVARPTSGWVLLAQIWRREGIAGWYAGAFPQVFNAVLKEALLNQIREVLMAWSRL